MSRTAPQRRAPKRHKTPPPAPAHVVTGNEPVIEIVSLDMEARGVGRTETEDGSPGKVIFVEGALPGERVSYSTHRSKPKFEQAEVVQVFRESVIRTKPSLYYEAGDRTGRLPETLDLDFGKFKECYSAATVPAPTAAAKQ